MAYFYVVILAGWYDFESFSTFDGPYWTGYYVHPMAEHFRAETFEQLIRSLQYPYYWAPEKAKDYYEMEEGSEKESMERICCDMIETYYSQINEFVATEEEFTGKQMKALCSDIYHEQERILINSYDQYHDIDHIRFDICYAIDSWLEQHQASGYKNYDRHLKAHTLLRKARRLIQGVEE